MICMPRGSLELNFGSVPVATVCETNEWKLSINAGWDMPLWAANELNDAIGVDVADVRPAHAGGAMPTAVTAAAASAAFFLMSMFFLMI